ncbi:MAG: hypothetical protein RLY20_3020 [Verrucomicrobiota bacterium]
MRYTPKACAAGLKVWADPLKVLARPTPDVTIPVKVRARWGQGACKSATRPLKAVKTGVKPRNAPAKPVELVKIQHPLRRA